MKLDIYAVETILARKGVTMTAAGIDSRCIAKAKQGKELKPHTVKHIADVLGVCPEDITSRW